MIETILVAIPLMLTPGPGNLASFVFGARLGARRLVPFQLGNVFVYAVVALALGTATVRVTAISPGAAALLQAGGGLFLIYLGVQLARRTRRDAPKTAPTFASGVVLQMLNPKYPGVILAVFANRSDQPAWLTALILAAVGALGLFTYSAAGALLFRRGASEKGFRKLEIAGGAALCGVGVWFVISAVMSWMV